MIYFIQGVDTKRIKIGYTSEDTIYQRLDTLQTGSAEELKIVAVIPEKTVQYERKLHSKFDHLRVRPRNEWFHPDEEIWTFIANHAMRWPQISRIKPSERRLTHREAHQISRHIRVSIGDTRRPDSPEAAASRWATLHRLGMSCHEIAENERISTAEVARAILNARVDQEPEPEAEAAKPIKVPPTGKWRPCRGCEKSFNSRKGMAYCRECELIVRREMLDTGYLRRNLYFGKVK